MRFLLLSISILICSMRVSYGQSKKALLTEQQVYNLNNNAQYDSSFALLNHFLHHNASDSDRYYGHLYMSYTYKRLFDYKSTLVHLDSALYFGLRTHNPEYYQANITCQRAFAMFDRQNYKASDSLMLLLSNSHYKHLDKEHTGKIISLEAFMLMQNQNYEAAEKRYQLAAQLVQESSPCDLPMIYGKMIELYGQKNDIEKMYEIYRLGIKNADSCKILKYTMYMNHAMQHCFEREKKYEEAFFFLKKTDSLHDAYNEYKYLGKISNVEQKYAIERKDLEIKTQKQAQVFLIFIVAVLVSGGAVFMFLYFKVKQQNKTITQQYKVNEQVISIISHDIKEPLLAVKLLLKKLNIQDKIMVQVSQSLEQQISSVNHILTSLLEIRKSNAQNTAMLFPALTNVLRDLHTKIESKELTVINQTTELTEVPISPEKLRIILYNILSNAIKYSHYQGEIILFNTSEGFAIQDFGAGIPTKKLNTLLKDAVISEKGTAQEEGNGMGLYIMGQIVKQSKIDIRFVSDEGKGTTVHITY
ncbi:Histidine kinase-, DNA gyrase B-, and HSP90-like ATPase [Flexibacter flexilis DSM 6793]|uniref:Histidine kinase-, DNA gyrase B-, and HSP90-like ATPase n=1 Tax=Flexibacter flexilis DSM 6793 TaxID=927664 RepID=A0A1I1NP49_9BACT|nr:sensor histidine kinase [Flexibacter flexilis]SFC99317.1 Histidine kinase-, DNA gyrase B-, and HSP90-like ATPase [Flexibacter flexilis DSM 6793]